MLTLDGHDIDDDEALSLVRYTLALKTSTETVAADLVTWKMLISRALRKFHGIMGQSINVEYVSVADHVEVLVERCESRAFRSAVENYEVSMSDMGVGVGSGLGKVVVVE